MSAKIADLVGQSIMLAIPGPEVTPEVVDVLGRVRPCGVILFARNIRSREAVHALTTTLQAEAARLGLPPLLFAVDQEGGIVNRLPEPFVVVPSQMAQGATGDPATAYACGRITGRQLRAVGINVNFAPVLDVNNNPANPVIGTRSFGEDPAAVARFGVQACRGLGDSGVVATAKHFPGHGDTHLDSHLALPVVSHPRARLDEVELLPFRLAAQAGIPAMMTAHMIFSALDDRPATLSRQILTGLLRRWMGFDGLIFTDALDMAAIAGAYGAPSAACQAKAAGADVVLPLGTLDEQIEVAASLAAALAGGQLAADAFGATVRRLDRVRASYGITHAVPPLGELDRALDEEAVTLAARAVTVVRGADRLPLPASTRLLLIDCDIPRWSLVEQVEERSAILRAAVRARFPRAWAITLPARPSLEDTARAVAAAGEAEAVLLITRNADAIPEQAWVARALAARPSPLLHAAVRTPYDARVIPEAATTLLTYGDPPVSLRALVDVLAGHAYAGGSSPVTLSTGGA